MANISTIENILQVEEKTENVLQHKLLKASREGDIEKVKKLIESGRTNPHTAKYSDGDTPLHCATLGGHTEIVRYLISDCECDPNVKDKWGRTPLHRAAWKGRTETIRYLVTEDHSDPNVKDEDGQTPLYWAVTAGHTETVRCLMTEGHSDPNVNNIHYVTPLSAARYWGHKEVETLLLPLTAGSPTHQMMSLFKL